MKTLNWKFSLFVILLGVATTGQAKPWFWGSKEYSKVVIKEFPMSADRMVGIANQYGAVNVETWDQDAVKIKIEIVVDAGSEADAEKIYKNISFAFDENEEGVFCTTNIERPSSGFWSWWGSDWSSDFSVNYDVRMPAASHLDLSNKYGDCSVNGLTNSAAYKIKYGNLYAHGETGNVNLVLGYGKAKMEGAKNFSGDLEYCTAKIMSVETCDINSKYSNVIIEDAGDLVTNTKYDDYHLGRIASLKNSGKYDDFQIDQVSSITMQTQYADLEIGVLHHFANFDFRYGEVEVHNVSDDFRNININGNYAEFKFDMGLVRAFDLDFRGNYADISCADRLTVVEEDDEGSNVSMMGYLKESNAGGKISADVTYGSLKIR